MRWWNPLGGYGIPFWGQGLISLLFLAFMFVYVLPPMTMALLGTHRYLQPLETVQQENARNMNRNRRFYGDVEL